MGFFSAVRKMLSPVSSGRGWFPLIIREPSTGAWQRNQELSPDTVLAYHAVYACVTVIANDIGKLRARLVRQDDNGIWTPTDSAAFGPVLRRPNRFQNHIQFKQWWVTSKLLYGNAYGLKQRDQRGVVTAIFVLDPRRVVPLVSDDGSVYYQLSQDNLTGPHQDQVTVPASEIIHDRMNCLFHPLVGVSPLYAAGLAAGHGLKIQEDSGEFFANGARPSGILTAPGHIADDTALRLKTHWETNYGNGKGAGKVAVLGDGLKFEPMRMTAVDAQVIEQLKWTPTVVASCFHVPPFKIGLGTIPQGQKVGDLNQIYYDDCLQSLIEEFEACMDDGLGLEQKKDGVQYGVELDLTGLLRMDPTTHAEFLTRLVGGAVMTPNEARIRTNLGPIKGGDTVYMQQQDFSIEALAERDKHNPLAAQEPKPVVEDKTKELIAAIFKGFVDA